MAGWVEIGHRMRCAALRCTANVPQAKSFRHDHMLVRTTTLAEKELRKCSPVLNIAK
jgi:hypothetical protein